MAPFDRILCGLPSLDTLLDNIRLGDNVVWQVSDMEEYLFFVRPYCEQALADGRNLIYMHFTGHPYLLEKDPRIKVCEFDPQAGFETFTVSVRQRITKEGKDAFYVFDCLSDLQVAWATDLMMGNFFQVTCPYLFELDTVAYFPVLRGRHSYDAIARIRETTQLFLDVSHDGRSLYINPLKVWNRYTPTMFLPHLYNPVTQTFAPLRDGLAVSRFYTLAEHNAVLAANQDLDSWERFVSLAKLEYEQLGQFTDQTRDQFIRTMMSRDPHIGRLLAQYFTPEDYFLVQSRMLGTGSIGGKACGMLLARKIVERTEPEAAARMEPHDSFYLGSDAYYTYIVSNRFWHLRIRQKTHEGYFTQAKPMQEAFLCGRFPEAIRKQFMHMLDYFGQCPIIVRSSSLQEDGFGNAFAGKYESVFCLNSGTLENRMEELENAVRTVYASTMDVSALEYRRQRGLEEQDEQMAVLIQRVSGTMYSGFLMPSAAGVGYSYSAYRWNATMDPSAGMLRLVMGLGTRAVDRTEGDYPRIVSLDQPDRSTLQSSADKHRFSQNYVDLMDYERRGLSTRPVSQIIDQMPPWYRKLVLEHDTDAERMLRERGERRMVLFASCAGLAKTPAFTSCMQRVLKALQTAYNNPVDIEFTVNAGEDGDFVFNLLQCRPLQTGQRHGSVTVPEVPDDRKLLHVLGGSMGGARELPADALVWVDPIAYYHFPYKSKPDIARVVGAINRFYQANYPDKNLLLFVPGRIGTSSPELGVPVSFADIHNFKAIFEVSEHTAGYMPELSFGSHMFQDLVEADIFYTAVFENEKTPCFNRSYFQSGENLLAALLPDLEKYADIVRVLEPQDRPTLYSDAMNTQTLLALG